MITSRPFIPRSRALRRLAKGKRRAFTILEMLVALAVFMVLLAAVFVPIKLAGDLSGVGIARANTQQAAVDGIRIIRNDITKAIAILPNDRTNGITDTYPYLDSQANNGNKGYPYRRDAAGYTKPATAAGTGTSNLNACRVADPTTMGAPNTARLDLILPASNVDGTVDPNVRSGNVLVSYYARRRDMTKAFDPIENPVVLYRAQIPFQYVPNSTTAVQPFPAWGLGTPNADLSNQRFTVSNPHPCIPRNLQWLTMNQYGEFDLTALALPPAGSGGTASGADPLTFGSHQLVLPRDTSLLTPNAAPDTGDKPNATMSLVPDSTFVCSDTNKDGKLDTVVIQLSVGQYDENSVNRRTAPTPVSGVGPRSVLVPQVARTLTETVFDPNIQ